MDCTFNPNMKIIERFAEAFYNNGTMKKTHLHLVSRLRWDLFIKYLDWLESNDLIAYYSNGKNNNYALTDLGKETFDKLTAFLKCIRK